MAKHEAGLSYRGKFLLEPLEPRVLLSADSILSEVYRSLQDDEARGPGRDFAAIVQEIDAATSTQISAAVRAIRLDAGACRLAGQADERGYLADGRVPFLS